MARDLVRSFEQQRLPPREVREAIRGFTADIEGGNDFIREKWHNNTNPPIMNPRVDLTFGTQDEGPRGQFEEPEDSGNSLRYGGKTRPTIPHADPGITEPVARNSLGKSRERNTSIPPHTQGSSHIRGVKYYPKTHNPTGVGRGKCRTCCWNCGKRGHLAADCRQSPLNCRFCGSQATPCPIATIGIPCSTNTGQGAWLRYLGLHTIEGIRPWGIIWDIKPPRNSSGPPLPS